jgi:hypothetical protein
VLRVGRDGGERLGRGRKQQSICQKTLRRPQAGRDHGLRRGGSGLAQYAEMFRANDIDIELLGRLTNDDLKDIGVVSFGHRKKLLEAIAELAGAVPVSSQPAIEPKARDARDLFDNGVSL